MTNVLTIYIFTYIKYTHVWYLYIHVHTNMFGFIYVYMSYTYMHTYIHRFIDIYMYINHIDWKRFMVEGWTLNLSMMFSKGVWFIIREFGVGGLREINTVIKYIQCWCCNTKWFNLKCMFRVYPYWQDSFVNSVCSLANLITLNNSTGDLKLWGKFVILPGCASLYPLSSLRLICCQHDSPLLSRTKSLTIHPGKSTHSSWKASPVSHKSPMISGKIIFL